MSVCAPPVFAGRYLLLVAVFALGLMAKPMLVTLPFVLLLLDYWPLGRMTSAAAADISAGQGERSRSFLASLCVCVLEKVPLLLLMAVFCGVTSWTKAKPCRATSSFPSLARSPTPWFPTLPIWVSFFVRWDWPCFIRIRDSICRSGKSVGAWWCWRASLRRRWRVGGGVRICSWAGSGIWGCWCR